MKKILFSVFLVLTLLTSYSCLNSYDYIKVYSNFNLIKVGMTKKEVTSLVGKPRDVYLWSPNRFSKPTEERWILNYKPGSVKVPSCIFSISSMKVIRTEIVDSDYLF